MVFKACVSKVASFEVIDNISIYYILIDIKYLNKLLE